MTEQSKAQRLAELLRTRNVLTGDHGSPLDEAAAELRRLDALNAELVEALEKLIVHYGGPWCDAADFAGIDARETLAKAKEQT